MHTLVYFVLNTVGIASPFGNFHILQIQTNELLAVANENKEKKK